MPEPLTHEALVEAVARALAAERYREIVRPAARKTIVGPLVDIEWTSYIPNARAALAAVAEVAGLTVEGAEFVVLRHGLARSEYGDDKIAASLLRAVAGGEG